MEEFCSFKMDRTKKCKRKTSIHHDILKYEKSSSVFGLSST